jgi:hypothetical protein
MVLLSPRPMAETPEERALRREQILEYGEAFGNAQYAQLAPTTASGGRVEIPPGSHHDVDNDGIQSD